MDLDLTYFEKGGFDLDLDLNFIGFDLKKPQVHSKSITSSESTFSSRCHFHFGTLLKKNCEPLPPHPKE